MVIWYSLVTICKTSSFVIAMYAWFSLCCIRVSIGQLNLVSYGVVRVYSPDGTLICCAVRPLYLYWDYVLLSFRSKIYSVIPKYYF